MNFNPYEVLNLSQNASIKEIEQARRRLARIHHPDKSKNHLDEQMKRINLAYEILTDEGHRREFLENNDTASSDFNHSTPNYSIERLPGYEFLSKEYLSSFEMWRNEPARKTYKYKFPEAFREQFEPEINLAYEEYMNKNENRYLNNKLSLQEVYLEVERFFFFKDNLDDALGEWNFFDETICRVLFSNRKKINNDTIKPSDNNYAIINLKSFSLVELKELLFALDPKKSIENNDKTKIIEILTPMLPNLTWQQTECVSGAKICFNCGTQKSFFSLFYNCIMCRERFCEECILKDNNRKLAPIGFTSGRTCSKCLNENEKWEVKRWLNKAHEHLKCGSLNKALFCFYAALQLDKGSVKTNQLGTKWMDAIENHKLKAIFLFDIIQKDFDAASNAIYLNELASCLQAMANSQSNDDDKYILNVSALKVFYLNKNPKPNKLSKLIQENIELLFQKAAIQNYEAFNSAVLKIINLINYFKLEELVELLLEKRNSVSVYAGLKVYFGQTNIESLQNDQTKASFLFAKGVFGIFLGFDDEEILIGFTNLERAYWMSLNFSFGTPELYVSVLMNAISLGIAFPFEQLFRIDDEQQRIKYFLMLLPKRDILKPRDHKLWASIKLRSKNLRPFQCYEKTIYNNYSLKLMNWDKLKSILSYIDLINGCENIFEVVFCFIHAAAWSLEAMDDKQTSANDKYAYSRLLFKCIENATHLSYMYLDTITKACVFQFLFGLAFYGNRFKIESDNKLVEKLFKFFLFGSTLLPVSNLQLILVSESTILACNARELVDCFAERVLETSQVFHPMEKFMYKYLKFERSQHSIRTSEVSSSQEDIRVDAMNWFLEKHNIDWTNVVDYIDYPLVERSREGWMLTKNKLGIVSSLGNFAKFNGFTIDTSTNEITLLLETATNPFIALFFKEEIAKFDWSDIATVLCNVEEASPSFFSLDPIDEKLELHPFQKFDYSPKHLKGSNFLHTLFHTDYLLKQFSMGIEVSCLPPFNQRAFTEIPSHLKEILKSVDQRGQRHTKVSRMWIQAENLDYELVENQNQLKFLFGDVKMSIKTHPMIPNNEGKLVDTDANPDKTSPEYLFAKDLTDHYDEIAKYYPEFARLKELCKLQYLGLYVKNYLTSLDKNTQLNTDPDRLNQVYNEMLESCNKNTNDYMNIIIEKIRKEYLLSINMNEFLEQVSEMIHSAIECGSSVSRNSIKKWLAAELFEYSSINHGKERANLVKAICSSKVKSVDQIKAEIEKRFRERKSAFEQALRAQSDALRPIYSQMQNEWPKEKTEWVPALFKHIDDENRFIYGGVLLCPTLNERVNIESTRAIKNSNKIVLTNQTLKKVTESFSKSSNANNNNKKFSNRMAEQNCQPASSSPRIPMVPVVTSSSSPKDFNRANLSNLMNNAKRQTDLFPSGNLNFKMQLKSLVNYVASEQQKSSVPFRFAPSNEKNKQARDECEIEKLKKEWSTTFKKPWPNETINGKKRDLQLRHIFPIEYGGPNRAWNIMPVRNADMRTNSINRVDQTQPKNSLARVNQNTFFFEKHLENDGYNFKVVKRILGFEIGPLFKGFEEDIKNLLEKMNSQSTSKAAKKEFGKLCGDQNSFTAGNYALLVSNDQDIVLHRLYGGKSQAFGSYFTLQRRNGGLSTAIDLALNPKWGNTMSESLTISIPKDFIIFVGRAAPQETDQGFTLFGGELQVYVPTEYLKYIYEYANASDEQTRQNVRKQGLKEQEKFFNNYNQKFPENPVDPASFKYNSSND